MSYSQKFIYFWRAVWSSLRPHFNVLNIIFAGLFFLYAWGFWNSVSEYWFNPNWTTDDARQQVYPFLKALKPGLFKGDIVTLMMECYLAPLHYWVSYAVTKLTADVIMMGHWVMLIQLLLLLLFVFLAVKHAASIPAAFFAAIWMLHTRPVVQRLTGGVPRGWAAPLLAAWIYFVIKGNHKAVLVTILIGCILHAPSTLIVALAYGLFLLWRVAIPATRKEYLRHLLTYLIVSPVFAVLVLSVVKMPPEIGHMATLEEAARMPEYSIPHGRFPFLPFMNPISEIKIFGFQAFINKLYQPDPLVKPLIRPVVLCILLALLALGYRKKVKIFPAALWFYLVAIFCVYFASRVLAFRLYVPDRHLQFPLAIFFVVGFSIAFWRVFSAPSLLGEAAILNKARKACLPACALVVLGAFVWAGSGSGFDGTANFNIWAKANGSVYRWIRDNTAEDAVIAGDLAFMDGTQLFGQRTAFISAEAAQPFYDSYYETIKPRIEVSFRALYARNLNEFMEVLAPYKIDYFVFPRRAFLPASLKKATYFEPHWHMVRELVKRDPPQYAFFELPEQVDLQAFPAMPFSDRKAALIDLKKLRAWAQQGGTAEKIN